MENKFKKDCPHCVGTGKTNRHGADNECTCSEYEEIAHEWSKQQEERLNLKPGSVMDFISGGWKKELGKKSNIRSYDSRGLSQQDYAGEF